MNREFKPTSKLVRTLFATAALLASSLVVGSTVSLAEHYNAESQLARAQQAVVAQR
jgi:hypothetical protein